MDPVTAAILSAITGQLVGGMLQGNNTQQISAPVAGGTANPLGGPLGGGLQGFGQPTVPNSTLPAEMPFGNRGLDTSGLQIPTPEITPQATTGGRTGTPPTGTEEDDPFIGEILAALPEAIAAASELLGFGPEPPPQFAPVAGHATNPGQLVQGFNLPQGINIGQLLSALPRIQ